MKNKGRITYIIIAAITSSVIIMIYSVMFLNEPELDEKISFAVSLIRLVFSVLTFILAILLFDRFGFRKKIYEKKLELVIDLLTKLKQLRISIFSVNKNEYIGGRIDVKKDMFEQYILNDLNTFLPIVFDPENIFNSKNILKIKEVKNNPLLPKNISESLEFLFPVRLTDANSNEEYNRKFIQIDFNSESRLKIIDIEGWAYPDKGMTLKVFITHFEDSLKIIEDWLDSHSNIKSELNI